MKQRVVVGVRNRQSSSKDRIAARREERQESQEEETDGAKDAKAIVVDEESCR